MNYPTETVNVLPHLQELRVKWREQDFQQQEEYDMLKKARSERVKWFYELDRVQKGPKVTKKVQPEEEEDS